MVMERIEVSIDACVAPQYSTIGVLNIKNGCCEDKPVLLTANMRQDDTINYSCQCACGGWCTTGMDTTDGAVNHYRRMSDGENIYGDLGDGYYI